MWKALLETCVLRAVRINNFFEKRVRVVLSPDVDGILSTVLLSEYLWTRHGVTTEIVGTYNGRHVRTVNGATAKDLRNCLWVDLDVRFTEVAHSIGQHFLGPLTVRTAAGAFNPNVLFQVEKMAEKYPFGTAHLVLFGLCPEIADRADGIAKALLCHADSCFWVCGKYRKNARRWAERMFPNHPPGREPDVRRLRIVLRRRPRDLRQYHPPPRLPRQGAGLRDGAVAKVHRAPDRPREQPLRPVQER